MKRLYLIIASVCVSSLLWALQPTCTIPLYPEGALDSNGYVPEDEYVKNGDKIYKVAAPRIDVYLPGKVKPSGILLSIPGGGYSFVSSGNEGVKVAEYFVPQGYIVAVLKYRLPNNHEYIPLHDALQSIRILRDSAEVWKTPDATIGVIGFSAGGHLAASLLTHYTDSVTRPDFGILVYPVISMDSTITHAGSCKQLLGSQPTEEQRLLWSAEKQVTPQTPPCLIVACQDDPTVKIENSIRFYQALTANNVPSSLLIVPLGKHGWGFSRQFQDRDHIDKLISAFIATSCKEDYQSMHIRKETLFDRNKRTRDWAKFRRYADSNAELVTNKTKVNAVFYGNSITYNWAKMRPEFFHSHGFVGRGISGQTSSEMLVRFRQDVIELHPKNVVILCGTNDIAQNNGTISLENTMGNIISMCELAKANKIRPVLCSVLPARSFRWNPFVVDAPQQIQALNEMIKAYAAKNKILYVDYYSAMVDTDGGLKKGLSKDEVHPLEAGYAIMEPIILKTLKIQNK